MKWSIGAAMMWVLCGCSGDTFVFALEAGGGGPDAGEDVLAEKMMDGRADTWQDAPSDAQGAADTGADGAMCMLESGQSACTAVVSAYCAILYSCCGGQCQSSWQNDMTQCKAHYSCSGYAPKTVCKSDADACGSSLPMLSCGQIWSTTEPVDAQTSACTKLKTALQ
jgi:hypothetical protein